jgi:hypothetical protein
LVSEPLPQDCPCGHAPQSIAPLQPSPITPQYWPLAGVQDALVQFGGPQTLGTFAPHTVPLGHEEPQSIEPPQPSPITPQYVAPETEQLVTAGVHPGAMQMCLFGSQAVPEGQAPQSCELSQPSPITPQY